MTNATTFQRYDRANRSFFGAKTILLCHTWEQDGVVNMITRTHDVDAWHQCIMPGPIILICSNIKIMKYNNFFIEIGIYKSRFDTQYI